jgi:hypothetical protein
MPQQIRCLSCKALLKCSDEMIAQMQAGHWFPCPKCQATLELPAETPPAPAQTPTQPTKRTGTSLCGTLPPNTAAPPATAPSPPLPAPQAATLAKSPALAPQPAVNGNGAPRADSAITTPGPQSTQPAPTHSPPMPQLPDSLPHPDAAAPPQSPKRARRLSRVLMASFIVGLLCLLVTAGVLVPLFVWQSTNPPPSDIKDYGNFGVIEVGDTGIKPFVVQELAQGNETNFRVREIAEPKNVKPGRIVNKGKVDDKLLKDVAAIVSDTVAMMRTEHKVKDQKLFVVYSSGFEKQFGDANGQTNEELAKSVKDAIKAKVPNVNVETMNHVQEAGYGAAIVVPHDDRDTSLYLDIGGGNLKGGYFEVGKEDKFQPLSPLDEYLGSRTFAEFIKNDMKKNQQMEPYPVAAARQGAILKDRLARRLETSPEMGGRTRVYLNGGIAWIMALCTHPDMPEEYKDHRVPISVNDIRDFRKIVEKSRVELGGAKLSGVDVSDKAKEDWETTLGWEIVRKAALDNPRLSKATPEHKQWLIKELDIVKFSNDRLLAGVEILSALDAALDFDHKELYFYRDGHVAWPLAFINEKFQAGLRASR